MRVWNMVIANANITDQLSIQQQEKLEQQRSNTDLRDSAFWPTSLDDGGVEFLPWQIHVMQISGRKYSNLIPKDTSNLIRGGLATFQCFKSFPCIWTQQNSMRSFLLRFVRVRMRVCDTDLRDLTFWSTPLDDGGEFLRWQIVRYKTLMQNTQTLIPDTLNLIRGGYLSMFSGVCLAYGHYKIQWGYAKRLLRAIVP